MEKEKKIYIGSGKTITDHEYLISGSLSMTDIENWIKDNPITPYKNGKSYLPITISTNKMPDKFGNTHSITINTWKPKLKERVSEQELFNESVPF
jgi:hypothetical protein